ncbi:MAG: heme-binding domain-containing protein [Acidobacteria bacterium]|nr:heme-binding domain-containing protein [Acidobacteriota bacterium]
MQRWNIVFYSTITLALSLVLARVHPFGDAGLYAQTKTPQSSIMQHSSVPPEVRATLIAKCADCHSTQTRAPFYGHLAPFSWLMERDIMKARDEMNLTLWDTYSADNRQTLTAKIVQQARSRKMPVLQYTLIHRDANLTDAEIQRLVAWSHEMSPATPADSGASLSPGDAARGKQVFEKRCTGCHAIETSREGPALGGVYGRKSGSYAGFVYSDALKKAGIVWNDTTLDQWLTDPDAFVSGNNMDFHVAKPQERKDVIAFLKTVK